MEERRKLSGKTQAGHWSPAARH